MNNEKNPTSPAAELFARHIGLFRELSEKKGILLVDVLPHFIGDPLESGNFGIYDTRILSEGRHLERLTQLIEKYQPIFYEQELSKLLEKPSINMLDLPKETLKKWNAAIKQAKKQSADQKIRAREAAPQKTLKVLPVMKLSSTFGVNTKLKNRKMCGFISVRH